MSEDSQTVEADRRQSFRLDMEKELVDIVWTGTDGIERNKKIVCLDFSRGGLKLDCDQAPLKYKLQQKLFLNQPIQIAKSSMVVLFAVLNKIMVGLK